MAPTVNNRIAYLSELKHVLAQSAWNGTVEAEWFENDFKTLDAVTQTGGRFAFQYLCNVVITLVLGEPFVLPQTDAQFGDSIGLPSARIILKPRDECGPNHGF